jgi:hypothetical protein
MIVRLLTPTDTTIMIILATLTGITITIIHRTGIGPREKISNEVIILLMVMKGVGILIRLTALNGIMITMNEGLMVMFLRDLIVPVPRLPSVVRLQCLSIQLPQRWDAVGK